MIIKPSHIQQISNQYPPKEDRNGGECGRFYGPVSESPSPSPNARPLLHSGGRGSRHSVSNSSPPPPVSVWAGHLGASVLATCGAEVSLCRVTNALESHRRRPCVLHPLHSYHVSILPTPHHTVAKALHRVLCSVWVGDWMEEIRGPEPARGGQDLPLCPPRSGADLVRGHFCLGWAVCRVPARPCPGLQAWLGTLLAGWSPLLSRAVLFWCVGGCAGRSAVLFLFQPRR